MSNLVTKAMVEVEIDVLVPECGVCHLKPEIEISPELARIAIQESRAALLQLPGWVTVQSLDGSAVMTVGPECIGEPLLSAMAERAAANVAARTQAMSAARG